MSRALLMNILKCAFLFLCISKSAFATLVTNADGNILHKESGLVIPSRAGDQVASAVDHEKDTITYSVEGKEFSSNLMIASENDVPGEDAAVRLINAMIQVRQAANPSAQVRRFDPPPYMDATKNAAAFVEGADNGILMYTVKLPHHVVYYSAGFSKSVTPEDALMESRKVFQLSQWPDQTSVNINEPK